MPAPLSERQLQAALLIASGKMQVAVAEELGVCKDTVTGWKSLPGFNEAVQDYRREIEQQVIGSLKSKALEAIQTLSDIMSDPTVANRDRINAASKILDLAVSKVDSSKTITIESSEVDTEKQGLSSSNIAVIRSQILGITES